jgi:hypothetical protein
MECEYAGSDVEVPHGARTGEIASVPMKEISELVGICPVTGNFYTEHFLPDQKEGADEYDVSGSS